MSETALSTDERRKAARGELIQQMSTVGMKAQGEQLTVGDIFSLTRSMYDIIPYDEATGDRLLPLAARINVIKEQAKTANPDAPAAYTVRITGDLNTQLLSILSEMKVALQSQNENKDTENQGRGKKILQWVRNLRS